MADQSLPASAQAVWAAYEKMAETKRQHFEYLHHLEEKYQPYGRASEQEQTRLDLLLRTHDTQVETFRTLLAQLRIEDSKAYGALLQRLTATTS